MKKVVLVSTVLFMFVSVLYASTTFTCYRYVKGKPTGTWIKVKADSKEEAEAKAYARFKKLGGPVDSCNCHY